MTYHPGFFLSQSLGEDLGFFPILARSWILTCMPRKLRIEYPGAIHHVMNRGNQRQDIDRDDQDRARFLETLAEACGKTAP